MTFRINPLWWPLMAALSPVLIPVLLAKNRRFKENQKQATLVNQERIGKAKHLDLPVLKSLEVSVLQEWATEEGFMGEPGVSYLFKTELGSLLLDVAFGPDRESLAHNSGKMGINFSNIDALAISHLHPDHMGGMKAFRSKEKKISVPEQLGDPAGKPCYLPGEVKTPGFSSELVTEPRMLAAGIASTGPLARSLFFLGFTEEQVLVAKLEGKGLVIFTGCGHPTIEVILNMATSLSDDPIYAIGGGLHFPLTSGRGSYEGLPGMKLQMIVGTGKPPWRRISDYELSNTIKVINAAGPKHVFLSEHDTCDYSIKRFKNELKAETKVLKAGATYSL
ncbi:MAG: MBL fold metallo-hydrolase [Candidatus Omnitrophota bacterium]|nr:MBL fold metallo-hydrolase [Candidatus Omnitrophota bacterium]